MPAEQTRRRASEQPRTFAVDGDGARLFVHEWAGDGPPLVFAHATSFHGRCWDEVIRQLPGRRAVAFDLRGHGRAEVPPIEEGVESYLWATIARDLVAAMGRLELTDAVGVGHSMGGHSVTLAQSIDRRLFAALLLVDPTIARDRGLPDRPPDQPDPLGFVTRRRQWWTSVDEMFERFRQREPHRRWQPQVLRDYCHYGLLLEEDERGSYRLACPPEIEATIYEVGEHDLSTEAATVDIPVRVLRARQRDPADPATYFSGSPTARDVANWFPSAEDVPLPQYTHFIPMEAPGLVARHVEEMAGGVARTNRPPAG